MKTKLVLTVILTSFIFLTGCSNDSIEEPVALSKNSVIDQTYPGVQKQVLKTFGAIGASITNGAGYGEYGPYMDELISYHTYGPKFIEFNNGQSFDSAGNEDNERQFGVVLKKGGVKQFAAKPGTLKVAVYYGNVANVTFISDFIMVFEGQKEEITIENLITLLFVKTKGEWKIVHEHHSPLKIDNPVLKEYITKDFVVDPIYNKEQKEVMATFGALGASIANGAGHGYYEPMDELISYHAYGEKFTEFNYDGEGNGHFFDGADNEHNERQLFGVDIEEWDDEVNQLGYIDNTFQVAVYNEKVANVTFISDFKLTFKGDTEVTPVNNLITLLFVKIKGEWKIVHEHHSPLGLEIQ